MRWLRWVAAIADLDRLASWCGDWRVGGRAGAFSMSRFWPVRGAVLGASAWRGPRERAPSAVLRGIYCLHGCTLFCVQLIYYNALALPCGLLVRGPGVCSALNPAVRL